MNFRSCYDQGFVRIAASTMRTSIAIPPDNAATVIRIAKQLDAEGVGLAVFPELCLTGYAIDDLLLNDVVLEATLDAIEAVREASSELLPAIVVGAPLRQGNRLYNCAVVLHRGRVLGVVPKSYLPNYREFYEKRHFAEAPLWTQGEPTITLAGVAAAETVPFGAGMLFKATDLPDFCFSVEICEDMWVPLPPSTLAAMRGATVLVNISGSPITVGRADDRELLCRSASARDLAAYVYAAGGPGESSTDLSWDGQTSIHENGALLASTERFPADSLWCSADIDLDLLRQERMRQNTFNDCAARFPFPMGGPVVEFTLDPPHRDIGLRRQVDRFPFVPDDPSRLAQDCYEAYSIQVYGLKQRVRSIGTPKIVIGVSGGLDSTHALLVAARAMDELGRPRSDILAFTLPGFATSDHTRNNATALATALGCSFDTIDIRPAAEQMLADLGHPTDVYDVTYENVQAGLRTDYLFRIANQRGGIVLGTGDLSELALGWCTYGVGDQMNHYGVNAGVPKTLIQHLIRWVIASGEHDSQVNEVLQSILDTEITPELVPTTGDAKPQSTQGTIGPYNLHDFFLYWTLRHGMRPSKIAYLAEQAWVEKDSGLWPEGYPEDERVAYDLPTITGWLGGFGKRFFANQFKRSALPNGPKVVAGGSLSPRGDWRMPSDASSKLWLADLENVPEQ
ncbi:NAD(+) synthase [Propionimicrobium sp. PCR01-08-3]|uniref:NAD(+) synthase n=1 Tax=Propionimicrobium sp. PCR01-08-3 TaxID=3052086 RepID=UPI00255CCD07|nr:NAD(+) synthase [Propionimicrobium sp. PCR01-08-3]WIY82484.1 NAD(+) synthase [Propionimicrobium sp. PCR01-08-3]